MSCAVIIFCYKHLVSLHINMGVFKSLRFAAMLSPRLTDSRAWAIFVEFGGPCRLSKTWQPCLFLLLPPPLLKSPADIIGLQMLQPPFLSRSSLIRLGNITYASEKEEEEEGGQGRRRRRR